MDQLMQTGVESGHDANKMPQVRPLTKKTKDNSPYKRSQEVEAQILSALQLAPKLLLDRAQERDYTAPGYLSEECLIYFIREYHRQDEEDVVGALLKILFRRCAKFIARRLRGLDPQLAEDAFSDIIAALLDQALDLERDRGDFMEVRFWVVLERIAITIFGKYRSHQSFSRMAVPLSMTGANDEEDDPPHGGVREEEVPDVSVSPEDFASYREDLNALPEEHRTAFILRCQGWPIESSDPDEPTISRYFGKTPRTIRNWLALVGENLQPLQARKG